jgi:hypothetical protein
MSSSGIRKFKTMQDRQVDLMINQESNFIGALKVTGTEQSLGGIVSLGEATGGGPGAPVGNFLETGGGTMSGPIAYFPQSVTIDSDDNINIGFEQGAYSTYIRVTSGGATDDLINIIGAQFSGQDLVLQGTTGKTITIKTTGNIVPPGGVDFDLIDDDIIRAIFDDIQNKWVFWAGADQGGGHLEDRIVDDDTIAIVNDSTGTFIVLIDGTQKFSIQNTRIDLESLEVFGVEKMWFDDSVGSPTMVSMGANGVQFFDINVLDDAEALNITFAGDDSARFQDGRLQLFSKSPNTLSASMSMFKDDPSPSANDALANIDFDGRDLGGNFTTYTKILGGIEQAIEGAEEGRFTFQVAGGSGTGGALKQAMRIAPDRIEMDDVWITMDEISLPINPDANKGKIYLRDNVGITTPYFLDSAGTETSLFLGESDRIIDDDTIAIVNDSTKTFIVLLDGVQKFSLQETRIDLESLEVFGVEKLWFDDSVGSPTMVTMGANGVQFFDINILDDTEALNITFAGDDMARFANGRFQLFSGTPNTLSSSMSMFRDDPSPGPTDALADIDFDGRDGSGNFTTYASILGGIGVATHGSERGNITFQVTENGGLQNRFRIGLDTIDINFAAFRFDSISNPSTGLINATQGMMFAKDEGSGTTAPYWIDDNGVVTSLILGGSGGGGNDAIIQIVKEFSLPDKNNSTTLSDDAELKFDAEEATVYYIEFNVAVFSATNADIKFGVSLPTGATYRIAYGAQTDQFSASGSSNANELDFSTGTSTLFSLNFFAIVEMGGTAGEVALSYAQQTAQVSTTTVQRGSMMRVYVGGTHGSATGNGTISDIQIGTFDTDHYDDDGFRFFGNDNGETGIGIVLGTTEPAGFTYEYTVVSGDFPTPMPGWKYNLMALFYNLQVFKQSATNRIFHSRLYINGILEESRNQSATGGSQDYLNINGQLPERNWVAGDTIEFRLWVDVETDWELQQAAFCTYPSEIEVTGKTATWIFQPAQDGLYAEQPQNITSPRFINTTMQYSFSFPNAGFSLEYGGGKNTVHFGEYYLDIEEQNTLKQTTRSTDEFPWPALFTIHNYRLVT